MSLAAPNYPDPHQSTPKSAYAFIAFQATDFMANAGAGAGTVVVNVYADTASAAAGKNPIDQVQIALGQTFVPANPTANPPVPALTMPTWAQLMADPQFAAAFAVVRNKLYAQIINHPNFAGAVQVP